MRVTVRPPWPCRLPGPAGDGLLRRHAGVLERLVHIGGEPVVVRAASTGDREVVYKALLAHPLIGQIPQVEELVEKLLKEGRAHLPQFEPREVSA